MYGEVAPSLRFKSDAVQYAQGLGKLKNMYVRRSGGVSNRPGFESVKMSPVQTMIPAPGGPCGVKAFTAWSNSQSSWITVLYYLDSGTNKYAFSIDDGVTFHFPSMTNITGPTPDKIRYTYMKDRLFITPPITIGGVRKNIGVMLETSDVFLGEDPGEADADYGIQPTPLSFTSGSFGYSGVAPFLPVTYLTTVTYEDGSERFFRIDKTSGYTSAWNASTPPSPAANIVHPHAQLTTNLVLNFATGLGVDAHIKTFNFYRAAGVNGLNSFFRLAGRVQYTPGSGTVNFFDFGADDASQTPPLDGFGIVNPTDTVKPFVGAKAAAYYQQRGVYAMEPGISANIKSGDSIASKLGAPKQIRAPIIYSDTGAFQFSVPVTDGTPIVAYLAMERLFAFTERAVYIIRGGEQGVLTPTMVNPLVVSEEGCSRTVEPVMCGKRGYFINNSHVKLMGIIFGIDGNASVFEATEFSEHVMIPDVAQMVALADTDNTLYLLMKDGTLTRVTCAEDGSHGFSRVETSGYIESIYRGKAKRPYAPNMVDAASEIYYDVLMAYVIRNGTRYLERLNVRDDRHAEGEFFADAYIGFGERLTLDGVNGYKRIKMGTHPFSAPAGTRLSLLAADYTAGQNITIRSSQPIIDGGESVMLHFYYDVTTDGVTETKTFEISFDEDTEVAVGNPTFPYQYTGTAVEDVPTSLRDVHGNATLTTLEKMKRETRWLPAVSRLYALPELAKTFYSGGDGTNPVDVSVVADGDILSSPLNPNMPGVLKLERNTSTSNLQIEFGAYYAFGYIGLPYESEFETLDIEASDNRTLTDSNKLINAVGVGLYETRGGFYGVPGHKLEEREEDLITASNLAHTVSSTGNRNGYVTINIPTEYNQTGRVNIKQVDPAPMTILAVYPKGISGE